MREYRAPQDWKEDCMTAEFVAAILHTGSVPDPERGPDAYQPLANPLLRVTSNRYVSTWGKRRVMTRFAEFAALLAWECQHDAQGLAFTPIFMGTDLSGGYQYMIRVTLKGGTDLIGMMDVYCPAFKATTEPAWCVVQHNYSPLCVMGDRIYGRVLDAEQPYLIYPNETKRAVPEMFLDRKQRVIYHQLTDRLWESDQDLLRFELGEANV